MAGTADDEVTQFLRYPVPDHQDAAVLLAALADHGYDATSDYEHALTTVTVACRGDRDADRERVRAILQRVHATSLSGPDLVYGPVRFEDEPGDGPHTVPPGRMEEARTAADRTDGQAWPPPAVAPSTGAQRRRSLAVPLVRGGWGLLLVMAPTPIARALDVPPTTATRLVLRVLGSRQLVQAAVTAAADSPTITRLGVAVDSLHALTAFGYAASSQDRRRAGLVLGSGALAFAASGVLRSRA